VNKKLKLYKTLVLLLLGTTGIASEGNQILYSINMPGNPFQQPYYQMMIKADNENRVYSFSKMYTFNACAIENGCGSYWDNPLYATSDYVSLYSDTKKHVSILYGLTPYIMRGYTEGAAQTLSMQRPAQVQLPFNPLAQMQIQNGVAPLYINATLPDYSDVFLAQTAANIYQSLHCTSNNCTISSEGTGMPSWYGYIPKIYGITRGVSALFYGTLASLTQAKPQTTFSPYNEKLWGWGSIMAMGVTKMSGTGTIPSTPQIFKEGVFAQNSWLLNNEPVMWGFPYFSFAPVISPGYAGDAVPFPTLADGHSNPTNPLATVVATGDLTGNYSVLNTNYSYIPSGDAATTYDGFVVNNGMSYFQLFAQNMQWFSLQAPLQTPLSPLVTPQNITPGQGIFSDAIQIAAMQAPNPISKVPVFTGSVGTTAGITGPVMMSGAISTGSFTVPQAFLSELTVESFKVGRYLQVPLASQTNGVWSGGLSQAAQEDPFQYYQGVTPLESRLPLMPLFVFYLSDPGLKLWEPGEVIVHLPCSMQRLTHRCVTTPQ
jgi:hypothetical protein